MRNSTWFIALAEDAEWAAKEAKSVVDHDQFLRFAEHWRRLADVAQPDTASHPSRQGRLPE